jgi:hypothetical protein
MTQVNLALNLIYKIELMGLFNRTETFKIRDIKFQSVGDEFHSKGMKSYIEKEIKVAKNKLSFEQITPILTYLVEFIQDEKLKIKHGEKLSCFTWSVIFIDESRHFEILEVYPEKEGYIPGFSITHQILNQQLTVCDELKLEPDFPLFDQYILIDPLVKTGLPANLFRWNKADPNSGWVAMTSEFTGNEFEQLTIGQFISYYKNAAQFLALPAGYKVLRDGDDAKVGFDEQMTVFEQD